MIETSPAVLDALTSISPVVALESAVITHGMPRRVIGDVPDRLAPVWRHDLPANAAAAIALKRTVEDRSAVPATIAVIDGIVTIGADDQQIIQLAECSEALKLSSRDIARALMNNATGGTTVAATLRACSRTTPPIAVLATGGIGGVHRDREKRPDVSADLIELSRNPVCVVCSGAKSILDVEATFEHLETLAIPVVGYQCTAFPRFVCPTDDSLPLTTSFDDVAEIARFCCIHWEELGNQSAVVVVQPVPDTVSIEPEEYERACMVATERAAVDAVGGAALTPFLLAETDRLTSGRALTANLDLLAANASVAADIASVFRSLGQDEV